MKRFTTLTAAIALTTSTAFAEGYQPPQEPEPPVVSCCDTPAPLLDVERADKTDLLVPLLVIIGIAIAASRDSRPSNPPCVTNQAYSGEKLDPYLVHECD